MYLPGLHVLRGMAWKIEACAANVRTTTTKVALCAREFLCSARYLRGSMHT